MFTKYADDIKKQAEEIKRKMGNKNFNFNVSLLISIINAIVKV